MSRYRDALDEKNDPEVIDFVARKVLAWEDDPVPEARITSLRTGGHGIPDDQVLIVYVRIHRPKGLFKRARESGPHSRLVSRDWFAENISAFYPRVDFPRLDERCGQLRRDGVE